MSPNYKGVAVNSFGLPIFKINKISRIKNKNRKRNFYLTSFVSNFGKDAQKNLILMYDIPHTMKKERDWFRRQLKNFGFIMIQKSVWVGPSPLPKDFISYLKKVGIEKEFKTFKITKSYSGKSNSI
ncbi:MAG: CRISPR-associated endonuclease Cas2 [Patescibacteria group bacterium]